MRAAADNHGFIQALCATGPAAEYADKLLLYGQFVGSWEAEARAYLPDGGVRRHWWSIHFAWALEGRAVQDVWITPPRQDPHHDRSEEWGPFTNQYGSSFRVYDPKTDTWNVSWIDPCSGFRATLVGCWRDGEIYQEGVSADGGLGLRWIFSEIRTGAFRWRAELSKDAGRSWFKALELQAKRSS